MTLDHLERGGKLIGKLLAIIVPLVGAIAWVNTRASASDVTANKLDISVMKAEHGIEREYDLAWKKWMTETVGGIGVQMRVQVSPPPMPPHPDGGAR